MTFYDYKVNSSKRTWKFNKIVTADVMNIEYIHPLKQKIIVEIVEKAQKDSGVKSIQVFGSAITNACDFESDLDLCIDWNFDCYDTEGILVPDTVSFMHQISMITKGKCDVVHLQYLEGTVVEQDAREGVVVYVYDGQS